MRRALIPLALVLLAMPAYALESKLIAYQELDGQLILIMEVSGGIKAEQAIVVPRNAVSLKLEDRTVCAVTWGDNKRLFRGDDVKKILRIFLPKPDALNPEIKKALGLP